LFASTALGQNAAPHTGFFVGVDAGQSDLESFTTSPYQLFDGSNGNGDDRSTAFKLRAGYRFSRYFTLETGYAALGGFSTELFVPCVAQVGVDCSYDIDTSIDGAFVNAVGTLPIGQHFYFSATVGGLFWKVETTSVIGTEPPGHESDSGAVAQYGIGLGFPLTERFEITLDWMRTDNIDFEYDDVATFGSYGGEITIISAGARFIF
jgi:OmpA-OmpF porin, OOP family